MFRPHPKILETLLPAFDPCKNFGHCKEARWEPASGHMPRGFLGTTGELSEVEVIMVFKEPGHPFPSEQYAPDLKGIAALDTVLAHTYEAMIRSTNQFHRNIRRFLDELYPSLSFDEQLRKVWMTEGRLCSVDNEIGGLMDRRCADHYLKSQLFLLPHATIVGFGNAAKKYLSYLGADFIGAYALAPPGCNHKPAKPSWQAAIDTIEARRNGT